MLKIKYTLNTFPGLGLQKAKPRVHTIKIERKIEK